MTDRLDIGHAIRPQLEAFDDLRRFVYALALANGGELAVSEARLSTVPEEAPISMYRDEFHRILVRVPNDA